MNEATATAWQLWDRVCRLPGQGLVEGQIYRITDLWWEIFGYDMIVSHATVRDADGKEVEIKNAHIAFDIDDIIDA